MGDSFGKWITRVKKILHETYYSAIETHGSSLTYSDTQTNLLDMELVSLSGVVIDEQKHWSLRHSDALPAPCRVSEIADSSGEWTSLAMNREGNGDQARYLVFSDYAGYAPIFYSLLPGLALVFSDSFSGVVQGLSSLGSSASFNIGNYLTLLSGRAATFDTLVSNETMANEIFVLRPNEAIVVDAENAFLIERAQISRSQGIFDYEKALTSAVQYSSNMLSRFISENLDKTQLLTLTGGVDSRLVFALLSTTPYLKHFQIWTMDPRKAKSAYQQKVHTADVEISNQIRQAYNLDWMPSRDRKKFSVSFVELLARHQSFNSNFSFKFSPSTYLAAEANPILTLRGGGGELLRGTGGARLASGRYSDYRKNGGSLEQVRWAAEDYLQRSVLTEDFYGIAKDFLVQQLNSYTAPLLREKLDSFYRDTRNRAHFGHYRVSESLNDYLLQVLSSPHFQRLTELAGYDYISAHGLVRDIFDSTKPKLRKFPFENASAHDQLHVSSRKGFKYKRRDGWLEDFDLIASSNAASPFGLASSPEERGESPRKSLHKTGIQFLSNGFALIESLAPGQYQAALREQHEMIMVAVKRGNLALGIVVSKVASAIDIAAPLSLSHARHFFTVLDGTPRIPTRDALHDASFHYRAILELTRNDKG